MWAPHPASCARQGPQRKPLLRALAYARKQRLRLAPTHAPPAAARVQVGPTISCEGSPYKGNAKGEWRANPHVQSYVLATDQVRSGGAAMPLGCAVLGAPVMAEKGVAQWRWAASRPSGQPAGRKAGPHP